MAKLNYSTTIAVDTRRSVIQFFSMVGNDISSIEHSVKSYSGLVLDEAFANRFKDVVQEYVAETPSDAVRKISLVVPDNAVALDTVNVPTMQSKGLTKNALNLTLGEIYRNVNDLKVHSLLTAQNKQYSTFSTAAVQNKLLVDTTTFAASSTIGAVATLNPKLRNATYLFLDIKNTYSRFVFVVNGRAAGFYPLPFGLEFLARSKYIQEDMLFDHTMAELTVLNAREKAKAKKLTVLAEDAAKKGEEGQIEEAQAEEPAVELLEDPDPEDLAIAAEIDEAEAEAENDITDPFAMSSGQRIIAPKVMAKKTPRRLPKFMQRPIPETSEGIICENFRVFVKWALSLLMTNEKITQMGKPEFVCVNVPEVISYVIDSANEEAEENGIEFRRIGDTAYDPKVLANLELYGGLFPKAIHPFNKF